MRHPIGLRKVLVLIFLIFSCTCCERKDPYPYIIFPLGIGNEYFYSYTRKGGSLNDGVWSRYVCDIKWRIINDIEKEVAMQYDVEEIRFNRIMYSGQSNTDNHDTSWFEPDTAYFIISDNSLSGKIKFPPWGSFPKYSATRETSFCGDRTIHCLHEYQCRFIADTGLVDFSRCKGTTHHPSNEYYRMDSVHIIP